MSESNVEDELEKLGLAAEDRQLIWAWINHQPNLIRLEDDLDSARDEPDEL